MTGIEIISLFIFAPILHIENDRNEAMATRFKTPGGRTNLLTVARSTSFLLPSLALQGGAGEGWALPPQNPPLPLPKREGRDNEIAGVTINSRGIQPPGLRTPGADVLPGGRTNLAAASVRPPDEPNRKL